MFSILFKCYFNTILLHSIQCWLLYSNFSIVVCSIHNYYLFPYNVKYKKSNVIKCQILKSYVIKLLFALLTKRFLPFDNASDSNFQSANFSMARELANTRKSCSFLNETKSKNLNWIVVGLWWNIETPVSLGQHCPNVDHKNPLSRLAMSKHRSVHSGWLVTVRSVNSGFQNKAIDPRVTPGTRGVVAPLEFLQTTFISLLFFFSLPLLFDPFSRIFACDTRTIVCTRTLRSVHDRNSRLFSIEPREKKRKKKK